MKRLNKLKRHYNSLRLLHKGKSRNCRKILKTGGSGLMNCLCEISKNVLKGNVPLTRLQTKKLSPHKHTLRKLLDKKKLSLIKKQRLVQKGGFLNALLGPVLNLLGGFLRG